MRDLNAARRRRFWWVARLCIVFVLLVLIQAGCANRVTLTRTDPTKRTLEVAQNALDSGKVSESTLLFLEERDKFRDWKSAPLPVLAELSTASRDWKNAKDLLSLAELCFYQATKEQKPALSTKLYLTTAVLAYQALFHAPCGFPTGPYEPESYIASQYYNRSLAKYVIAFRDANQKMTHGMSLDLLVGSLEILGKTTPFSWPPEEVERYLISSEFKIKGLRREGADTGLGAPLVFQLKPSDKPGAQTDDIKQARVRVSTLVLRMSHSLAPVGEPRYAATVELYDPLQTSEYQEGAKTAPLASDYSTALAFVLLRAPSVNPLTALLSPDAWEQLQGLIMMQPYQKGKIPVVLVHGLMSSPLTWASMLNRLMTDEYLRQRYQFWFFGYPTSNPILYSAAAFREALLDARKRYDPEGADPAFDKLVLVGHSMGGLLSRFMTMSSDMRLWKEVTNIPLDPAQLPAEQRDLMLRMLQYEPVPFVSRVLFLATPHRGAHMADDIIGRLGASLITLPFKLVATAATLLTHLNQGPGVKGLRIGDRFFESMPTGIDSLSPVNPMLLWGAKEMERSRTPFHSIIGNLTAANVQGGEDGVVTYASSHLNNARSEIVVRSDHSVQDKAPTVAEVRRILLEHVAASACDK